MFVKVKAPLSMNYQKYGHILHKNIVASGIKHHNPNQTKPELLLCEAKQVFTHFFIDIIKFLVT